MKLASCSVDVSLSAKHSSIKINSLTFIFHMALSMFFGEDEVTILFRCYLKWSYKLRETEAFMLFLTDHFTHSAATSSWMSLCPPQTTDTETKASRVECIAIVTEWSTTTGFKDICVPSTDDCIPVEGARGRWAHTDLCGELVLYKKNWIELATTLQHVISVSEWADLAPINLEHLISMYMDRIYKETYVIVRR